MFIPGVLITLITFPGVIVHELAHQLFCRVYKIPVFKVVYFQVGNPAGYVLHEVPETKWQTIMISVGPFFINTLFGALIALPAALPVLEFGHDAGFLDIVQIYLGVSIAMHAFPSTGDANVIWSMMKEKDTPAWLKLIGYPVVGIIYLGAIGSFFWLDLVYGIGVVMGFPHLLIGILY
jgi:hypothetical protein